MMGRPFLSLICLEKDPKSRAQIPASQDAEKKIAFINKTIIKIRANQFI
jgi:hypothetical protein